MAKEPIPDAQIMTENLSKSSILRCARAKGGVTAIKQPVCNNLFVNEGGDALRLRGVAMYSKSPLLAELAGRLGFEAVWIEMEHAGIDFDSVEHMCRAVEVGGAIPVVRVPDGQRHHVLRALEIGARIVVVPMINTAEQAREVVDYGKFPPLGRRGYSVRSRGVSFGLDNADEMFHQCNQNTHLFVQIETREAVGNLQEICCVPGLSGILVGPGDLSVSINCPGRLSDPILVRMVVDVITRARKAGLSAGILIGPGKLLDAAIDAGANLLVYAGDVATLTTAWSDALALVRRGAIGSVSASMQSVSP